MAKPGDLKNVLAAMHAMGPPPAISGREQLVGEWARVNHAWSFHNGHGPTHHYMFMAALAISSDLRVTGMARLARPWWYEIERDPNPGREGRMNIGCKVCDRVQRVGEMTARGFLLDHEHLHVSRFPSDRVAAFEVILAMRFGKDFNVLQTNLEGLVLECWEEFWGPGMWGEQLKLNLEP